MRMATALCLVPTIALAQTDPLQSMARAQELGAILASEQLCDLVLDQAGIEAWIAAHVAKDDLTFASHLQMMTRGQELQLKDISASGKTAHCAAVRQSAAAAGLIK